MNLHMHLLFAHLIYLFIILLWVPGVLGYFVFTSTLFACLITILPRAHMIYASCEVRSIFVCSKPYQSVAYSP